MGWHRVPHAAVAMGSNWRGIDPTVLISQPAAALLGLTTWSTSRGRLRGCGTIAGVRRPLHTAAAIAGAAFLVTCCFSSCTSCALSAVAHSTPHGTLRRMLPQEPGDSGTPGASRSGSAGPAAGGSAALHAAALPSSLPGAARACREAMGAPWPPVRTPYPCCHLTRCGECSCVYAPE